MSESGSRTTADYLDFDRTLNKGFSLLDDPKTKSFGLYLIMAVNTGLRAKDLRSMKWENVTDGEIKLLESKTKKYRSIKLNKNILRAFQKFQIKEGLMFKSQKGSPFSIQHINYLLKEHFSIESKKYNVSSHSLRKGFGRRVYENNGQSEKSLVYLSELFNHSSMAITRRYLGIRQEELDDIYTNL